MTTTEQHYGLDVQPSRFTPDDFIERVSASHTGNAILRIGRMNEVARMSWQQLAHVVLTPAECERLAADLLAIARR